MSATKNRQDCGGIVYLLTCIAVGPDEGRQYVGLTTGPLWLREYGHLTAAEVTGSDDPLYKAMRRHRPFATSFTCEIVGEVDCWNTLRMLERATIRQRRTHISYGGFNLTWGGEGTPPLTRLRIRVQNEIQRRRSDLDGGNKHARKQFIQRHKVRWTSLSDIERTCILQHEAIKAEIIELLRTAGTPALASAALKSDDKAVAEAAALVIRDRPKS